MSALLRREQQEKEAIEAEKVAKLQKARARDAEDRALQQELKLRRARVAEERARIEKQHAKDKVEMDQMRAAAAARGAPNRRRRQQ